ncbi:MAG: thioredoxin domain-containing protein [Gammaproteobacteria bacterium]|nr:thioredoxin domain-containing protein [Gammaproteobacteria bacterium]
MGKREEQQKRKEEKQLAAKHREQTRKLLTKVGLFGIAPILLIVTLYIVFSQGPTYSPVEIADNDHIRGERGNPVSIVVYADFQCPACSTEHQTVTRIWPRIRDKAHLIFRHFPVTTSPPHAWTASLYAEAAGKQGRFWEMHDYLFAAQPIWAGLSDAESEFDSYALELDLNLEQLHADIESDEVVQKVRNDQRGGNSAGVRATPTLFINGRMIAQPTASRIRELVDEEFEQANGAD